jgi:hypothetical protein
MTIKYMQTIFAVFLLMMMQACAPLISPYDQYGYAQATAVKVDALNVMSMATDSFQLHKNEVNNLTTEMQKIYEYDKGLPKNTATTRQWSILMDPNAHLLATFLQQWQAHTKEDSTYVALKKTQVSKAFDAIIQLEAAKIKSK